MSDRHTDLLKRNHKQVLEYIDSETLIKYFVTVITLATKMNHPHLIKIRQVIDQMLNKCERIIIEGNKEYMDYLKKRVLDKNG